MIAFLSVAIAQFSNNHDIYYDIVFSGHSPEAVKQFKAYFARSWIKQLRHFSCIFVNIRIILASNMRKILKLPFKS